MYLSEIREFVENIVEESLLQEEAYFQIDSILIEESAEVIKIGTPYPEVMLKEIRDAGMQAGLSDTAVDEVEIAIDDKFRVMRWLIHKGYSSRDIKKHFPNLIR